MMQLLKTVQKNNLQLALEKFSLFLSIVVTMVCVFLYAEYNGFLQGEEYAISAYATSAFIEGFDNFIKVQDDYQVISKSYFFILTVLSLILLNHLFNKGILSKCANLFLLCLPVFEYWQIFELKQLALKTLDNQRFELFRQTVILDVIGVVAIICLASVQMILIFLIFKQKGKTE